MLNIDGLSLFLPDHNIGQILNVKYININILNTLRVFNLNSVEDYKNNTNKIKISILNPWLRSFKENCDLIDKILEYSNHIIIESMELYSDVEMLLKRYDSPKFSFIINGTITNYNPLHARYIMSPVWIQSTANFYIGHKPDALDALEPWTVKPYCFDFLPGYPRPHRVFVYELIKDLEQIYFAPFNQGNFQERIESDDWSWDPNIKLLSTDYRDPNKRVEYYDYTLNISQIVPVPIYNRTAYSVVMETLEQGDLFFPTEKITKPLLASRLFVVISRQHYLRELRKLGFKTFDSIIDESYDAEPDDHRRWTMAAEQIRWLCAQDQRNILRQVAPIALHNQKVLRSIAAHHDLPTELETVILQQVI